MRSKADIGGEVEKSTFARFLVLSDFRLLQQNRRKAEANPPGDSEGQAGVEALRVALNC